MTKEIKDHALRVLQRSGSTKQDLREALALALGVPCPHGTQKKESLFCKCQKAFFANYEGCTGISYAWQAKDNGCLAAIIKKLHDITHDTEEETILAAFIYLIDELPRWYKENGYSLCVINGKFNEIVNSIKNGNRSTRPGDLREAASRMG